MQPIDGISSAVLRIRSKKLNFTAATLFPLQQCVNRQPANSSPPARSPCNPENGATDVDPGLEEIRVTFDRPMQDGSWSLVGGGPHFPEDTGSPRYDSQRTTWRVSVKLKPEWEYEFHLNRGQFNSFRSAEGVPLESVRMTFKTGKARE
ncbi:MAG TPA: Ig-like domain-containing protein [Verrucomicrobia bacterium]|nr:Ig-like domain-containing protein [Verrucomicrobiota bacterium]HOP96704.1 Ig-like domain-containing protein [Verrucomicrobiota bacterium]